MGSCRLVGPAGTRLILVEFRLRNRYPFDFNSASCFLSAIFSLVRCGAVNTCASSELDCIEADPLDLKGLGVRGEG